MNDEVQENKKKKFEPLAKWVIKALTDGQTKLVCWNGRDYFFYENRYVADNLETRVRRWMLTADIAQSNALVANVLPVIRTLCNASPVQYPQMPFWTGAGDDCKNVIAYKNGRLNVDAFLQGKMELLPHSLHWVSTFCLPYNFNVDAKCERWLKFLDEVFGDDRVKLLQQWLGYCLLPHNNKQVCIHFQGPPASGKSTIGEVLRQLVGTENATGYSLDSLAREHGTAILLNKMVAVCGETNLTGHPQKRRIMERFTSIVGGDAVAVNPKYMDECSARLPVKFTVLSNEDVIFADHAGAMARRLLCLPFDKSFANCADDTLPAQLAAEIEGIAQWALSGLLSLEHDGKFHEPERTKEKKQEQRRSNSDVFAFLQDRVKVHQSCDP
ncbi:hypothetical protein AYO44_15930 [Planctomycetaceae bacterium SCGC AG-212-F19]|nr:hypothetical protein AYO44_15930 [Planctomycetaceae bacterium SCGC AG-212-F19]